MLLAGYRKVEATKYYRYKYRNCSDCGKDFRDGETAYVNPPHLYCEKCYNQLEQRAMDKLGSFFK